MLPIGFKVLSLACVCKGQGFIRPVQMILKQLLKVCVSNAGKIGILEVLSVTALTFKTRGSSPSLPR